MLQVVGSNLPMLVLIFLGKNFLTFDTGHTPQEKAHREETRSGEALRRVFEGKEGQERLRFN